MTVSNLHTSVPPPQTDHDADYQAFEKLIAERVAAARGPLFTTDATGLFEAYLAGIPGETTFAKERVGGGLSMICTGTRQHYNCNCCRRFIERYGGLVTIGSDGSIDTLLWRPGMTKADTIFQNPAARMWERVRMAKVTGVFLSSESVWGTPSNVAGPGSKCEGTRWNHLHGVPRSECVWNKQHVQTADQKTAELLQDYITLKNALREYSADAVAQAVRVLEHGDAVDRGEKVLGVAKWLAELHAKLVYGLGKNARLRDNLIWLAVATAPPGFCHVKSTMIGTLLDDIVQGLDFRAIKQRWDKKMHPLAYQRPQAGPSEQEITAANKLMEKLGAEGALARRYATLDDVLKFEWRPGDIKPVEFEAIGKVMKGGAFDSLRGKAEVKVVNLPSKMGMWEEFRKDVLPKAKTIEIQLTNSSMSFYGLVTAVNKDAPPMLQWDGLKDNGPTDFSEAKELPRNPTSWYFWNGGSRASEWGVWDGVDPHFASHTQWKQVAAIFLPPHQWQQPEKFTHQPVQVHFAISAAKDSRKAGGGYFPETLRNGFHGIRSVIERHSRQTELVGKEEGNANGVALCKGGTITVRVNGSDVYTLSL